VFGADFCFFAKIVTNTICVNGVRKSTTTSEITLDSKMVMNINVTPTVLGFVLNHLLQKFDIYDAIQ